MADEPTICPALRYADARGAVEQLTEAFGFGRSALYEDEAGTVLHAELSYGNGLVMLGAEREPSADDPEGGAFSRAMANAGASAIYVVVEDVDAHCMRARAAGARILQEPRDPEYGGRQYMAADLEGNVWTFGTYAPAVAG
jgi:uncharacterized glyoxalase superfamily protein PhnB